MEQPMTVVIRAGLLALSLGGAAPAVAQIFPEPLTPFVSDYAGVLDAATEARITDALVAARADPGTEVAVVTVKSRSDFGPHPSIESFANGLFNAWGIGDAGNNTGILILVAAADREMRIELGGGHSRTWDFTAEEIVHRTMLPALRAGDLPGAIENGTLDAIDRIARPVAANLPPPEGAPSAWLREWGPGALFAGVFGGIIALAATSAARRERPPPCPRCSHRRASVARRTIRPATRDAPGQAEEKIICRNCGGVRHRDIELPRKGPRRGRDGSSSGFGGGTSSGGGASGRW
jgi:uncharacterized protein